MQAQTQTGVDVYYLDFGDNDDAERNELLREMRHRVEFEDDYAPTQDDFDLLWQHVGHDPTASLSNIFPRWNAGSGQESIAFARRDCEDCDAYFDGTREKPNLDPNENPIDLHYRQRMAEQHEAETGHTVERSTRSLSVGDVVVVDGTAHVVAKFGFEAWEHIEVDG